MHSIFSCCSWALVSTYNFSTATSSKTITCYVNYGYSINNLPQEVTHLNPHHNQLTNDNKQTTNYKTISLPKQPKYISPYLNYYTNWSRTNIQAKDQTNSKFMINKTNQRISTSKHWNTLTMIHVSLLTTLSLLTSLVMVMLECQPI